MVFPKMILLISISFYRTQDLLASLRAAARIKDESVVVDFLGAILERK